MCIQGTPMSAEMAENNWRHEADEWKTPACTTPPSLPFEFANAKWKIRTRAIRRFSPEFVSFQLPSFPLPFSSAFIPQHFLLSFDSFVLSHCLFLSFFFWAYTKICITTRKRTERCQQWGSRIEKKTSQKCHKTTQNANWMLAFDTKSEIKENQCARNNSENVRRIRVRQRNGSPHSNQKWKHANHLDECFLPFRFVRGAKNRRLSLMLVKLSSGRGTSMKSTKCPVPLRGNSRAMGPRAIYFHSVSCLALNPFGCFLSN